MSVLTKKSNKTLITAFLPLPSNHPCLQLQAHLSEVDIAQGPPQPQLDPSAPQLPAIPLKDRFRTMALSQLLRDSAVL